MTPSLTNFPTSEDSKLPKLVDGQDGIDTIDLRYIDETLDALQTSIGTSPGDRTDIGGRNFGSLSANFRALCRLATGQISKTVSWIDSATDVDGTTYITTANSYWLYYYQYFNVSDSVNTFSQPPLVVTSCGYYSDSGSDDYTVMGVWKVSRSWVKFMPQGKNRHKWAAGGGAKGAYFNWIAFEPIHGRNENSVDEDEES